MQTRKQQSRYVKEKKMVLVEYAHKSNASRRKIKTCVGFKAVHAIKLTAIAIHLLISNF